ncbi:MAG: hypothetical protein LBC67_07085 [Spirochaetales bacterium]|nr:hypothetical protein [Spirochaetales bacterium]
MIQAIQFYDLLDCLAGQFIGAQSARCVGKEFGLHIISAAKDYFSIAIIPEKLSHEQVVLGVLLDDSCHIGSRNGYTFTIYIDLSKIDGNAFEIFSYIILAHEICHFAFYYELFRKLGENTRIIAHSNFTHTVSKTLIGAVTREQDTTSQTIFDEHNIKELVTNLGKYPKKHFAKGKETKINYHELFFSFLKHLHFDKLLRAFSGN